MADPDAPLSDMELPYDPLPPRSDFDDVTDEGGAGAGGGLGHGLSPYASSVAPDICNRVKTMTMSNLHRLAGQGQGQGGGGGPIHTSSTATLEGCSRYYSEGAASEKNSE